MKMGKKIWAFVRRYKLELIYIFGLVVIPAVVQAWTSPASGDFAYDVYNVAIEKINKGPVGYVLTVGCFTGSLISAMRNAWVPAAIFGIGGGVIYKLDAIAKGLGFIV